VSVVLGIDTASPVVGAAVIGPGHEREWDQRVIRGADAVLIPAIAALLDEVGAIDLVAVSVGPGAFTGLRVGVATALGFAVSRGLKVVCVSSLEARALLVKAPVVLSLLDARKGRVYAQCFDTQASKVTALGTAQDVEISQVMPKPGFVAVGEGAVVYAEAITLAGGVVAPCPARSAALAVAKLGLERMADAVEPQEVALTYLRDADAKKSGAKRLVHAKG